MEPTAFEKRFADDIEATLGCPDRVRFKGSMFSGGSDQLNSFVDRLGILRKDFIPHLEGLSDQLVDHAKRLAKRAGAPYIICPQHLRGQRKCWGQIIYRRQRYSPSVAARPPL